MRHTTEQVHQMNMPNLRAVAAVCFRTIAVIATLTFPSVGHAQDVTGTIDGVIHDTGGLAVPGVLVVANSPALIQRDLTAISDAKGYYRLPILPPGEYEISFTLQNFQTVTRSGIVVEVNRTRSIDIVLEPAPIVEAVTVTGKSPTLDQRGAKQAFNYSSELAQNIPTSRELTGLFTTLPGVESAGNYGVSTPGNIEVQNVLGAGGRANSYSLDGANTTDPAGQWNVAALFSFDTIQEVQVTKGAKPAEMGYQGGFFNVVTKSGGNQLSGQLGAYFQNDALQSENAGSTLGSTVQTTNKLKNEYEATATIGGRFVQDKAWWYGSARRQDGSSTLLGFPEDVSNTINAYFWKTTYQANQNHRFAGLATHWDQTVSHFFFGYAPAQAGDANASVFRPLHGRTFGLRWNGILGENVVAEASWRYDEAAPRPGLPARCRGGDHRSGHGDAFQKQRRRQPRPGHR